MRNIQMGEIEREWKGENAAHLVVAWEAGHGSGPAMAFHWWKVLSIRVTILPHLFHLYRLQTEQESRRWCDWLPWTLTGSRELGGGRQLRVSERHKELEGEFSECVFAVSYWLLSYDSSCTLLTVGYHSNWFEWCWQPLSSIQHQCLNFSRPLLITMASQLCHRADRYRDLSGPVGGPQAERFNGMRV